MLFVPICLTVVSFSSPKINHLFCGEIGLPSLASRPRFSENEKISAGNYKYKISRGYLMGVGKSKQPTNYNRQFFIFIDGSSVILIAE